MHCIVVYDKVLAVCSVCSSSYRIDNRPHMLKIDIPTLAGLSNPVVPASANTCTVALYKHRGTLN